MDCCVEYAKGMHNVVQYWFGIHELMDEVLEQHFELKEGFWPKTNWKRDHLGQKNDLSIIDDLNITSENEEEPYPYCDHAKEKLSLVFNTYKNMLLNDWVYCRHVDGDDLPIWMEGVYFVLIKMLKMMSMSMACFGLNGGL